MTSQSNKPTVNHRYTTGAVLYEGESGMSMRDMLEKATASGADLRGADLIGANLSGADLIDANLSGADLRGANLIGADLRGANLSGADMRGADMRGADMRDADMRDADLSGADMRDANLSDHGKLIGVRPLFQCGPIGSRNDYLMSFITTKGVTIKAGCFTGTLDEFRDAVTKTHADSDHAKEYEMAMLMIDAHAAIWTPKESSNVTK